MSKRQHVVKLDRAHELPLLVADIFEAAGAWRRMGEMVAGQVGQTQARWQVLSVFSADPLTVPQAARRLGITRQGLQRVVNELVPEGLLAAAENAGHLTSPFFVLTELGKGVLAQITERATRIHERLAGHVSAGDLETTRRTLNALTAALSGS